MGEGSWDVWDGGGGWSGEREGGGKDGLGSEMGLGVDCASSIP